MTARRNGHEERLASFAQTFHILRNLTPARRITWPGLAWARMALAPAQSLRTHPSIEPGGQRLIGFARPVTLVVEKSIDKRHVAGARGARIEPVVQAGPHFERRRHKAVDRPSVADPPRSHDQDHARRHDQP